MPIGTKSQRFKVMARVFNHVPDEGDLDLILIKGHLVVEEQLNAALRAAVSNPKYIKEANLRFSQLSQMTRAHYEDQSESWLWGAIGKLNKARNDLAHQLVPENIPDLVSDFLKLVNVDTSQVKSIEEELHKAIAMVAATICSLYDDVT